ncbi:MAG: hypothetical protein AB1758_21270 [Candidatus Eremiobacterota bacterium]
MVDSCARPSSYAWKASLAQADRLSGQAERVHKFLSRARGPLQRLLAPQGLLERRRAEVGDLFEMVLLYNRGVCRGPSPASIRMAVAGLHYLTSPVRVRDLLLGREPSQDVLDYVLCAVDGDLADFRGWRAAR